ncbi:hypothetical protein GIB67_007109 [Kingdonia uniflora]|uniref:Uncharacterized protein n=1 Tax=Kingdonia uniflora TaxID=39325 RepID=A0A7J7MLH2_9MAGN|nr:hypothetical protein GIB67_007109 [Kingdonia uniflora]
MANWSQLPVVLVGLIMKRLSLRDFIVFWGSQFYGITWRAKVRVCDISSLHPMMEDFTFPPDEHILNKSLNSDPSSLSDFRGNLPSLEKLTHDAQLLVDQRPSPNLISIVDVYKLLNHPKGKNPISEQERAMYQLLFDHRMMSSIEDRTKIGKIRKDEAEKKVSSSSKKRQQHHSTFNESRRENLVQDLGSQRGSEQQIEKGEALPTEAIEGISTPTPIQTTSDSRRDTAKEIGLESPSAGAADADTEIISKDLNLETSPFNTSEGSLGPSNLSITLVDQTVEGFVKNGTPTKSSGDDCAQEYSESSKANPNQNSNCTQESPESNKTKEVEILEPPKSWASLLSVPSIGKGRTKLNFIKPDIVNGMIAIKVKDHEFTDGIITCSEYLVGCFVSRRLACPFVKETLTKLWDIKGDFEMTLQGLNVFFFKFGHCKVFGHTLETCDVAPKETLVNPNKSATKSSQDKSKEVDEDGFIRPNPKKTVKVKATEQANDKSNRYEILQVKSSEDEEQHKSKTTNIIDKGKTVVVDK